MSNCTCEGALQSISAAGKCCDVVKICGKIRWTHVQDLLEMSLVYTVDAVNRKIQVVSC